MRCPSCGHVNADDARFCSICGHQLTATCRECTAPLPGAARFCPSCGSPVILARTATERKFVTVLFADVAESTSMAERLDPEDLHRIMQTYFEAMRAEIEGEGGTVEKYIGDAVMAVFGVPTTHEDDPARALRAALRMTARLDDVNATLRGRYRVDFRIRIGVNSGEVLATVDPQPGETLVTGDVVNAASRLQTSANPGEILVAERTGRAVRGFSFEDAGKRDLKGKSQSIRALRLTGIKAQAMTRGVPGLHAPMVGRDYEMNLLKARYRRVEAEKHADLVTIYGEPGVGKSRLAREFAEWAADLDRPPTLLRGRCLPYGDGITYWPLAEILMEAAGLRDEDSTGQALQRIRDMGAGILTEAVTTDAEATTAALAYTIGIEDPKYRVPDRDPREVRAASHAAWRAFFSALAVDSPVVVVIEDIHWADPAFLDLLESLVDRIVGPVMFLCPARPILTENRPGWGGGRRNVASLSLDPLSPAESEDLARFLLTVEDIPARIHGQILERAGGNPFFLEEIIRNLIDEGLIVRQGAEWRAAEGLHTVEIPDSVQGVLASRIDLLSPAEKRTLQQAAVVGRIFWPGPVARLLNGEAGLIRDTLDHLEERELIRSQLGSTFAGEPEYIFKHVLTREVAYDSVPRAERGTAHAKVAEWIEETAGERAGELVEFGVYHYQRAYRASLENGNLGTNDLERLRAKAYQVTLAASIAARRRYATKRAFDLAEQALGLAVSPTEQSKALRQKGRIANSDYMGDIAWESLRESADITLQYPPEDPREIARACAFAVEIPTRWPGSMTYSVDTEVVAKYIDAGLAVLSPKDEGVERIRLLVARAMLPWGADPSVRDFDPEQATRARESAEAALDMALRIDRFDLASAALDALSAIHILLGEYGQSLPIVERRLEIADLIKNPWEIGDIYATSAWTYAFTESPARAREIALEGFERSKTEAQGVQLHNLNWATYASFLLSDWDHIETVTHPKALSILGERAAHAPAFTTQQFGVKALISSIREAPNARQDRDRLEHVGHFAGTKAFFTEGFLAWIASREGDYEAARNLVLERSQHGTTTPFLDLVRATILFDNEDYASSPEFLASARAFAERNGLTVNRPYFDRLEGTLAVHRGDAASATKLLERASAEFSRLGNRWERARTDLRLAELRLAEEDREAARTLAAGALTVFADLSSIAETRAANRFLAKLDS